MLAELCRRLMLKCFFTLLPLCWWWTSHLSLTSLVFALNDLAVFCGGGGWGRGRVSLSVAEVLVVLPEKQTASYRVFECLL